MSKRFKKDDIICHDYRNYRCIVCDKETAAFARFIKTADGSKTKFKNSFFVSNDPTNLSFECTFLYNLNCGNMNKIVDKKSYMRDCLKKLGRNDLIIIALSWGGNQGFDTNATLYDDIVELILDSMGFE